MQRVSDSSSAEGAAAWEGHGGAAAAAAMIGGAASASSDLSSHSFTVVCGEHDQYRLLDKLDHRIAAQITRETGYPILIPLGVRSLSVVTTWSDREPLPGEFLFGKGQSGVFCLGRAIKADRFVGFKLSAPGSHTDREVGIHRAIRGIPGTLQALDYGKTETQACQVIEFAGLGSLEQLQSALQGLTNPDLREQILYYIARGLLIALKNLHDKGVYHLDVKPDNVVANHRGDVLLIDYDCAQESQDGNINVLECLADPRYFAPERLLADKYGDRRIANCSGSKLDAYSAGLLLLQVSRNTMPDLKELHTVLDDPFNELSIELKQLLKDYESALPVERFRHLLQVRQSLPDTEFGQVLRGLLAYDPSERLSPGEALKLPWFRDMETRVQGMRSLEHLRELVQDLALNRHGRRALSPQQPPRLSLYHTHRLDLESQIEDQLRSERKLTVLRGASGTGKSQLATYLISLDAIRSKYGSILWFRGCDDTSHLEQQFLGLAQELGLVSARSSFDEALPLLRHYYASAPPLIVYDNGGTHSSLRPYLDLPGVILVTTTSSEWKETILVDSLSFEEAHRLVDDQLHRKDALASSLCEALLHSPLALTQACAYIRNRSVSLQNYLADLGSGDSLQSEEKQSGYHPIPHSIQRMYQLTFEQFVEDLPSLQGLACLAPDPLSRSLLERVVSRSTLQRLVDYAILQTPSSDSYMLHQLPRDQLLQRIPPSQLHEVLGSMMDALHDEWDPQPDSLAKIVTNRALLNHGQHLLELCGKVETLTDRFESSKLRLLQLVIAIYCDEGLPQKAKSLLDQAVARVAIESTMTSSSKAAILNSVAIAYNELGKHDSALQIHRQALDVLRTLPGKPSLQATVILSNIAGVLNSLGDWEQALSHVSDAIEIQKSSDEVSYQRELARSYNTRGMIHASCGDDRKALKAYKHSLDIRKRVLGEKHPEVANTLNNMANVENRLGHTSKALQLHQDALRIRGAIWSETHPLISSSHSNLGLTYLDMGKGELALVHFTSAYTSWKIQLGDDHPLLASALSNMGLAQISLHQIDKAVGSFDSAIAISRKSDQNSMTARALNNRGHAFTLGGRFSEAIHSHVEAQRIWDGRHPSGNQPDIAAGLVRLSFAYSGAEDSASAIDATRKAQRTALEVLPAGHPLLLICQTAEAMALMRGGDAVESQRVHDRFLESIAALVGVEAPAADTLCDTAELWLVMGYPEQALICCDRVAPLVDRSETDLAYIQERARSISQKARIATLKG